VPRSPVALGLCLLVVVACHRAPAILSPYGSQFAVTPNADGSPRLRERLHDGVDVASDVGDSVIASAPGRVVSVASDSASGFEVVIAHDKFPPDRESHGAIYHTSYIHLRTSTVRLHEQVRRGQKLGEVGLFWASGGAAHVHWRVCRGLCRFDTTLDPLAKGVRCYSENGTYPTDRLMLTYPLLC
jgi:murein DD-endopeptidase MepM/ murein hydrolase activator NlpD